MKGLIAAMLCAMLLGIPTGENTGQKMVALTFDDGPSGKFTSQLLDGLEQRNVKATFLLCGYRMKQYPELTERIFKEGHEIGIHGYSHKSMDTMCLRDLRLEIRQTEELLPSGCHATFLRPPGGLCSTCVKKAAEERGLAILSWSVDPRDWATCDAEAVEREVLSHVRDGDVILLHDMSQSSVDAAFAIIDELQEQGFRFVTVSELAAARGTIPVPGEKYTRFPELQNKAA